MCLFCHYIFALAFALSSLILIIAFVEWNECGSTRESDKSDAVLRTFEHCFDYSSIGAVLLRYNDVKMGPANSLHSLS